MLRMIKCEINNTQTELYAITIVTIRFLLESNRNSK